MNENIEKGMSVNIFKANYNSECNVISYKHNKAVVIGHEMPKIFEPSEDVPAVKIVRHEVFGEVYYHAEPVDPCPSNNTFGYMFGGCYIACSDSRWREHFKYPVPLHDRVEE